MPHIDEHSKPFQKQIFGYVAGGFILVLIIVNIIVYYAELQVINNNVRENLQQIAQNISKNVSYSLVEKIQTNDQQQSSEYIEIEQYFQNVMAGNTLIDDIYILRPTENQNFMTFVVSGKESADANDDGFIDDKELRPSVGEKYDVTDLPELRNGLIEPSSDKEINSDKWGTWISGYAPVLNDQGKAVAVLGVDESASNIVNEQEAIGMPLLIMDAVLLPLLLLIAYVLARKLSKPFKTLAIGMQRVSHGELDYRLPLSGNKTEMMYEKLFNNMLGMYDNEINHLKRKKDDDFSN